MSLKGLKDVINEIFNEKFKHDQRCLEASAPLETMEQFLYTYLSKKYGLKVNLFVQLIFYFNIVADPIPSILSDLFSKTLPKI